MERWQSVIDEMLALGAKPQRAKAGFIWLVLPDGKVWMFRDKRSTDYIEERTK